MAGGERGPPGASVALTEGPPEGPGGGLASQPEPFALCVAVGGHPTAF